MTEQDEMYFCSFIYVISDICVRVFFDLILRSTCILTIISTFVWFEF